TGLVLDVHWRVGGPERLVAGFLAAGAERVAVHGESTAGVHAVIEAIRWRGGKAGVALNPATPVEAVSEVIEDLDFLTVLTADTGSDPEHFIPAMLSKVKAAAKLRTRGHEGTEIEVEGGIGFEH